MTIRMGLLVTFVFSLVTIQTSFAGVEGTVTGVVTDSQGQPMSNVQVHAVSISGESKDATTVPTGKYELFPLTFGDYQVSIQAKGFESYTGTVHVSSGATSQLNIQLIPEGAHTASELVIEVKAKRKLIHNSTAVSSTETDQKAISHLPQGGEISLPRLLSTTNPGVVQGPFGQTFFRGNHANIQYQIDGVQLPDSPSNTFGQAFSPRNIDHMEVITGGIPAEYGQRLAAVVNIVTKTGTEKPQGEVELNYGSYNAISPHLLFGGSNEAGSLHYFFSANYNQTDRGLDTPQPASESNQAQGATDSVHNQASGNNEFGRLDWIVDNSNKLSLILFNSESNFKIPNYSCSYKVTDAFFQPGFTDQFGNGGDPSATTFNFVPCNTNDTQFEANAYAQLVWKHSFSSQSFLQLAPYYKYSAIKVNNDPTNDLATSPSGATPVTGSSASSFAEDRHVSNLGLKGDYSLRANESNFLKAGFQLQASRSDGSFSVQTDLATPAFSDNSADLGYFESAYVQDDLTIFKPLILNAGLRLDATQFLFSGISSSDYLLQPRIGLNYLLTDTTKLHVFYGKLFQPAPVENLRDAFTTVGGGQLSPYDIKAEKDDYYEFGIAQQFAENHVAMVNVYYKNATNMLDDAQLLNTSIAQPYNFATGYAYGVEFSVKGQITEDWSEYANYSYEIAQGKGISGGIFAFPAGNAPGNDYQMLDHVQVHTANAGVTYAKNSFWWTTQGLFGSGLRTGPNNSISLPSHFTADTTIGYKFDWGTWLSRFKVSGDVINIFNNVYPITVANGFNGSHYAAGRLFYIRLTKEI